MPKCGRNDMKNLGKIAILALKKAGPPPKP
jgi:hypothetical protein